MDLITEPGTSLVLFILVTGGLVFYYLKLKQLQEIARIEHGLVSPPKQANHLKKWGLILISIGIAILVGYMLGRLADIHPLITIPSMILIVGGSTLLFVNQMK